MKEIRILPISVFTETLTDKELYDNFPIDRNRFKVIIDRQDPEYLLVTISHVAYKRSMLEMLRKYYSKNRIIIFEGDEAILPDLNIFDYAITYDDSMIYEDRVCHRPYNVFVWGGNKIDNITRLSRQEAEAEYERRKFCNFIYSNPNAFYVRDDLFFEINKYKRVDSLGKHLNNMDNVPDRDDNNWFDSSVGVKQNYRFSISAENGRMNGYTSEKIISSFIANSVPIYWGNPHVNKEFNPNAFIDCNQCKNLTEVIEFVKSINEDKERWVDMVTAPIQTELQRQEIQKQNNEYVRFLNHIFEQDIIDAKRCPQTTAAWNYVDFILNRKQ